VFSLLVRPNVGGYSSPHDPTSRAPMSRLLAVVAIVLLLGGCGNGDDDASNPCCERIGAYQCAVCDDGIAFPASCQRTAPGDCLCLVSGPIVPLTPDAQPSPTPVRCGSPEVEVHRATPQVLCYSIDGTACPTPTPTPRP
jgi:hypothetical protein